MENYKWRFVNLVLFAEVNYSLHEKTHYAKCLYWSYLSKKLLAQKLRFKYLTFAFISDQQRPLWLQQKTFYRTKYWGAKLGS